MLLRPVPNQLTKGIETRQEKVLLLPLFIFHSSTVIDSYEGVEV